MTKKWKWEKLEPAFDIGQAVWVIKTPIDTTAKSYVVKGFVCRIHLRSRLIQPIILGGYRMSSRGL